MELSLLVKSTQTETHDNSEREMKITDTVRGDPATIRREIVSKEHQVKSVAVKYDDLSAEETEDFIKRLIDNDIGCTVGLKIKGKLSFGQLQLIGNRLDAEGVSYTFQMKGKVNENSPINVTKPQSWTDAEYSTFAIAGKVTPSGSDGHHTALALFNELRGKGFDVQANVSIRKLKIEDLVEEEFLNLLPDGSQITLTLSEE